MVMSRCAHHVQMIPSKLAVTAIPDEPIQSSDVNNVQLGQLNLMVMAMPLVNLLSGQVIVLQQVSQFAPKNMVVTRHLYPLNT